MTRRNTRKLLQDGLKELRLPTMRSGFAQVAEQARADSSSYEEFPARAVDGSTQSRTFRDRSGEQNPEPGHG